MLKSRSALHEVTSPDIADCVLPAWSSRISDVGVWKSSEGGKMMVSSVSSGHAAKNTGGGEAASQPA